MAAQIAEVIKRPLELCSFSAMSSLGNVIFIGFVLQIACTNLFAILIAFLIFQSRFTSEENGLLCFFFYFSYRFTVDVAIILFVNAM